jgi:hypothetical protein
MAQVMFNHGNGKPPFFDGVSFFDHWKRKMKQYLGNIHEKEERERDKDTGKEES